MGRFSKLNRFPAGILPFCLALSVWLPSAAGASLLHGQMPLDGGAWVFSNASSGAQNADGFSASGPEQVESISWWGGYDAPEADNFIVRLLSDSGGTPGSVLRDYQPASVAVTPTALLSFHGNPVYRYDFALPDTLVLPSGTFYVSIMDETQDSGWYWLAGSGSGGAWLRADDGDGWTRNTGVSLAFTVNGTRRAALAEPGSLALVGAGLLAALARRLGML